VIIPILVTAPPEAEITNILSVAEFKIHERISFSTEDQYIEDCIKDAFDFLAGPEGWLNRSVLDTTWKVLLPSFPSRFEFPKPPFKGITKIRYRDTSNVWQTIHDQGTSPTLNSLLFDEVTSGLLGRMELAYDQSWPDTYSRSEAVEITYTAGYGGGAEVKIRCKGIYRSIRLLAGHLFQTREETYAEPRLVKVNRKIEMGLEKLAGRYRVPNNHGPV
jgi:hypothetical protein